MKWVYETTYNGNQCAEQLKFTSKSRALDTWYLGARRMALRRILSYGSLGHEGRAEVGH